MRGGFNNRRMCTCPKTYEKWYKGGVTTNPITWDDRIETKLEEHLGTLNSDGKIYDSAVAVKVIDGLLWSTVPRIPKRFLLSFIKSYSVIFNSIKVKYSRNKTIIM